MKHDKRYILCQSCAAEGRKAYDVILTYWERDFKGMCQRCKAKVLVAEYRLAEKDSDIPFTLGAYSYKRK